MILGLITGFALWSLTHPGPSPPQPTRLSVVLPASQRLTGETRDQVTLSPDGTYLAYVANAQTEAQDVRVPCRVEIGIQK